jgi:hypothetical protein
MTYMFNKMQDETVYCVDSDAASNRQQDFKANCDLRLKVVVQ